MVHVGRLLAVRDRWINETVRERSILATNPNGSTTKTTTTEVKRHTQNASKYRIDFKTTHLVRSLRCAMIVCTNAWAILPSNYTLFCLGTLCIFFSALLLVGCAYRYHINFVKLYVFRVRAGAWASERECLSYTCSERSSCAYSVRSWLISICVFHFFFRTLCKVQTYKYHVIFIDHIVHAARVYLLRAVHIVIVVAAQTT